MRYDRSAQRRTPVVHSHLTGCRQQTTASTYLARFLKPTTAIWPAFSSRPQPFGALSSTDDDNYLARLPRQMIAIWRALSSRLQPFGASFHLYDSHLARILRQMTVIWRAHALSPNQELIQPITLEETWNITQGESEQSREKFAIT